MRNLFLILASAALLTAEEYKAMPAGAPPAELAAPIAGLLEKQGIQIVRDGKPLTEMWFRAEIPAPQPTTEGSLTMPNVPHGSLMGAIRILQTYSDRRGQTIKAGLYTMRYSYYPENGDHQGAAPQRDFLLLTPAGDDSSANAVSDFKALVEMSKKASGTPHPCVFSIRKEDPKFFKENHVEKEGEADWLLMRKLGGVPVTMVIAGKVEA
ncbi:MAG: hypothetical protein FJW30_08075 [Acidobacteria bacterium]|nr:hypothetical protein [Acidobacteriota bacterium]